MMDMIEHLCGVLNRREENFVVVRVGGIGFQLEVPTGSFQTCQVGDDITVLTTLVFKQDAMSLYGFQSATERQFFNLLTGINGIGPKSALGILSHARPAALADAIVREDISTLTKVKGIGKKGAKRIILELGEKIKALKPDAGKAKQMELSATNAALEEARDVLLSLGCTEQEAQNAIEAVQDQLDLEADDASERLVMEALQALGGA
jgi:holliday junction DNA helicase RuvA